MRGGRGLCIRFFCENMHKTDYLKRGQSCCKNNKPAARVKSCCGFIEGDRSL